ncbi:MAG: tetratricopeptide repeat protein [Gammaproteobacteria bacterium]
MIDRLEKMLAAGQDSAALRFGLGNAYLKNDPVKAAEHLASAVAQDPEYSAAWKLLGRALDASGEHAQAADAFAAGIEVAERRGDVQAAKEMRVFMRRAQRAAGEDS